MVFLHGTIPILPYTKQLASLGISYHSPYELQLERRNFPPKQFLSEIVFHKTISGERKSTSIKNSKRRPSSIALSIDVEKASFSRLFLSSPSNLTLAVTAAQSSEVGFGSCSWFGWLGTESMAGGDHDNFFSATPTQNRAWPPVCSCEANLKPNPHNLFDAVPQFMLDENPCQMRTLPEPGN